MLDHEQVCADLQSGTTYTEVAEKHSEIHGTPISKGTIWRIASYYNCYRHKDKSLKGQVRQSKRLGWACGRPMGKGKGTYPNGYLRRADELMQIGPDTTVLHLFSGSIRGRENEHTMDIREDNDPSFVADAREEFPMPDNTYDIVFSDPPYDLETSEGVKVDYSTKLWKTEFIRPYAWVEEAIRVLKPGGHLLVLHNLVYIQPKDATRVCVVSITCGPNTRIRCLSIFRKDTEIDKLLKNADERKEVRIGEIVKTED